MRLSWSLLLIALLAGCGTEPVGGLDRQPVVWEGEEAWRADRTALPVVPEGIDIAWHLRLHPRDEYWTDEDGNRKRARYGGYDIDEAVDAILALPEVKRPARPWTVSKLLAWYEGPATTLDVRSRGWHETPRAAALTLLLASRDPRGIRAAGTAIDGADSDVMIAACQGIETYWSGHMNAMNLEMTMAAAIDWWDANRARFRP